MIKSGNCTIDKNAILARISELDIFTYYIRGFKELDKKFCSELRKDSTPTCHITDRFGFYMYKDFGTGETYNCFSYVRVKYGLSFPETLSVINNDFQLGLEKHSQIDPELVGVPRVNTKFNKQKTESSFVVKMGIKAREFSKEDLQYWQSFGISRDILDLFVVKSISHYWINDSMFKIPHNELAFAYCYGDGKYKIYRPFNEENKWCTNASKIIQGAHVARNSNSNFIFITSSLKDVMTLYSLGYTAIAPGSENTAISLDIIESLKNRFDKVVLFYDNDYPGLKAGHYHSQHYDLDFTFLPFDIEEKDISDYYEMCGRESSLAMLENLI